MWNRLPAALVLALALALCACQESKPNVNTLITGGGNARVVETRFVSSAEGAIGISGGTITYALTRIELTNDTNSPLYPLASKFYLLDAQGRKIYGTDGGSAVFTGVSNNLQPMKPGEKREFTVGFRGDPQTTGTVLYDY
ncbi:MAG: hypothetical protein ABR591_11790 [Candidatus Velthaea sp.]